MCWLRASCAKHIANLGSPKAPGSNHSPQVRASDSTTRHTVQYATGPHCMQASEHEPQSRGQVLGSGTDGMRAGPRGGPRVSSAGARASLPALPAGARAGMPWSCSGSACGRAKRTTTLGTGACAGGCCGGPGCGSRGSAPAARVTRSRPLTAACTCQKLAQQRSLICDWRGIKPARAKAGCR